MTRSMTQPNRTLRLACRMPASHPSRALASRSTRSICSRRALTLKAAVPSSPSLCSGSTPPARSPGAPSLPTDTSDSVLAARNGRAVTPPNLALMSEEAHLAADWSTVRARPPRAATWLFAKCAASYSASHCRLGMDRNGACVTMSCTDCQITGSVRYM